MRRSKIVFFHFLLCTVQCLPGKPVNNGVAKSLSRRIHSLRYPTTAKESWQLSHDLTFMQNDVISSLKPTEKSEDAANDLEPRDKASFDKVMNDYASLKHNGIDTVTIPLPESGQSTIYLEIGTQNRTDDTVFGFALVPGANIADEWVTATSLKYSDLRNKLMHAEPTTLASEMNFLMQAVGQEAVTFLNKARPDCKTRFQTPKLPECKPKLKRRNPTKAKSRASLQMVTRDDSAGQGIVETALEASRKYVAETVKKATIGYSRSHFQFLTMMMPAISQSVRNIISVQIRYARGRLDGGRVLSEYRSAIDLFCLLGTIYIFLDRFLELFKKDRLKIDLVVVTDVVLPLVNLLFDTLKRAGRAFDKFTHTLATHGGSKKNTDKNERCLNSGDVEYMIPAQPTTNLGGRDAEVTMDAGTCSDDLQGFVDAFREAMGDRTTSDEL